MPVTINTLSLFGDLPVTIREEPCGQQLIPRAIAGGGGSGSVLLGPTDPALTIEGTFTAATEAALNDQVQSLCALAGPDPTTALIDNGRGKSWDGYLFTKLELTAPARKGRVWSVPFSARFVQVRP